MAGIEETIASLQAAGIFDFYLPFFLLFAIFYALLTKSKIFGEPTESIPRKINLVISLIVAAYIMVYTPIGGMLTLSQYFGALFGQTFIILMSIVATLIIGYVLLGGLGVKMEARGAFMKFLVCVAIILGIGLFISSGGLTFFIVGWPGAPYFVLPGLTLQHIAIISLVVLTGLVLYWLTKPPKEIELTPEEREYIERARAARRAGG